MQKKGEWQCWSLCQNQKQKTYSKKRKYHGKNKRKDDNSVRAETPAEKNLTDNNQQVTKLAS